MKRQPLTIQVAGRVASGQGVASQRMRHMIPSGNFADLGTTLVPGTLNVDIGRDPRPVLEPLPFTACRSKRKHYRARIIAASGAWERYPVWVTAFPGHLEVLSDAHLRTLHGVQDGDEVALRFIAEDPA